MLSNIYVIFKKLKVKFSCDSKSKRVQSQKCKTESVANHALACSIPCLVLASCVNSTNSCTSWKLVAKKLD